MAESANQDDIMPLARTKHFLGMAETQPLPCAFAMTKDRKEVLLLIEKTGEPRKVADQLKDSGHGAFEQSALRWGEVRIDLNDQPKRVRFTINRAEASGIEHLLQKLVRRAGYEEVVFNIEEKPGQEPAPQSLPIPQPGAADLKSRLVGLVQHMAQVIAEHPMHRTELLDFARLSQESLAAGDLASAATHIHQLEVALAAAETEPGAKAAEAPRAAEGAAVAFAKSSLLWRGCRSQIRLKLETLKTAMVDAYAAEPEIQEAIRLKRDMLDHAFDGLDDRLDKTLDAAASDHDPAHVAEIRALLASTISHVAGNERIKALDANPFGVQLGLTAMITNVLTGLVALSKQMH